MEDPFCIDPDPMHNLIPGYNLGLYSDPMHNLIPGSNLGLDSSTDDTPIPVFMNKPNMFYTCDIATHDVGEVKKPDESDGIPDEKDDNTRYVSKMVNVTPRTVSVPSRNIRKEKPNVFISRLFELASSSKDNGAKWNGSGDAIEFDKKKFVKSNMHVTNKWVSYARQLNMYGFLKMINSDTDFPTFYHKNFLKDREDLLFRIERKRIERNHNTSSRTNTMKTTHTNAKRVEINRLVKNIANTMMVMTEQLTEVLAMLSNDDDDM